MTFKSCAKEWLVFYEGKVKVSTFIMYKQLTKQLIHSFGEREINTISHLELQQYLNGLHTNRYAKSTIQKHRITLNLIFKYFCKSNENNKNPCVDLYLPKGAVVKKRDTLSNEEISEVLKNFEKPVYLYPLFLLAFGLRRSEALALEWEDIDIDRGFVVVSKTIEFIHNQPHLCNYLKNGETEKIVPILDLVFPHIKKLKEEYKTGLIFSCEGEYLTQHRINNIWDKFREVAKLSVTQHQCRHAYATILYRSGVDLKTAMVLMGHKSLKMLLDIYAHPNEELLLQAGQKANKFIISEFVT